MKVLLYILSKLANLIPCRGVRFIGRCLGDFWYYCIPFRKKIVRENLQLAYKTELSSEQIEQVLRANLRHYGCLVIEILQSMTWSPDDFRNRIEVEGLANAESFYHNGRGGYFLCSHVGNWELLIGSGAHSGIPATVVVKRAKSPWAEKLLVWYRARLGADFLIETGTAKDILRAISQGRFVAFVLDQFMGPPIGLPVTFFGELAGTTVSLALLTEKRDVPILPAYSYRDDQGRLHMVIGEALVMPEFSADKEERLFQKTQFLNNALESIVRKHPTQWLWLHRRWKAYRGEPRWKLSTAAAPALAALALFVLVGCSSTGSTVPTGIEIPPDPEVAAPSFQAPPSADVEVEDETIEKEPPPSPVVVTEVAPKPKKPEKKKKEPKPVIAPSPKPGVPVSTPFPVLPTESIPFEIGERLEVHLGWGALSAGTATLEVKPGPSFNGRPTFHLWGNVISSRIVDAIYHVDNTVETFVDKQALIPYKFLLHMVESAQNKETRVMFDHAKGKAHFWSKRISKKWGDETIDRVDDFTPRAKDLWSGIYYARTLNYKLRQKHRFTLYENGKNWDVELTPVANELVTSKVGAFQCWKIRVVVKLDNVLRPIGDVFMWLSDDSKKYLVKFEAKIKIGSLVGSLMSIKER